MAIAPTLQYTSLLGDRRRFVRLQQLVTAWAQHAQASLAQALAAPAALKAAYRFFANRTVTPAAILATARPDCLAQMAAETLVLLIQDTTDLDFTRHRATTGLGPIGTSKQQTQGLFVHTCLAASAAGVPLGLAAQRLWHRDPADHGRAARRREVPRAAKESQRWLDLAEAARAGLPASVQSVLVADAEADIFALLAAPRPPEAALLIRVAHPHRRLEDGQALAAVAQQAPILGRYTVAVHATPQRQARQARCAVRRCAVVVRPPLHQEPGRPYRTPVALTALWVEEESTPPAGEQPLQWLLLTTLAATTFLEAATCVGYYSQRWLIEQYHYLLKTGCRAEALQLRQEARLERAVAACCLVAVRLLWLTYLARQEPEQPCTAAFDTAAWQALCCACSQQPTPPPQPPTLREAVRLVASLGGFLGRTS
ncbi:MAG TPA: IS4 family transposase, partial [Dehalococcoidia bacterium]|nr:IS4 family transposase [Dehalococcoidia bacterium]